MTSSSQLILTFFFMFVTCPGNANTLKTIYCAVFACVKYKLNTGIGMQLILADPLGFMEIFITAWQKIIWRLRHVILLTVNMTGQTTVSWLLLHVFSAGLCSASTTQLSHRLKQIHICTDIWGKSDKESLYANFIKVPSYNAYRQQGQLWHFSSHFGN